MGVLDRPIWDAARGGEVAQPVRAKISAQTHDALPAGQLELI